MKPRVSAFEALSPRPALAIVIVSERLDVSALPKQPASLGDVVVAVVTSQEVEPPGLYAQLPRIDLAACSVAFWNALRAASITPTTGSLLLPRGVAVSATRDVRRYLVLPLLLLLVAALSGGTSMMISRQRERQVISAALNDEVRPLLTNYLDGAELFLNALAKIMQGNPSNVSDFLATRDSLTEPINRFNTGFTEFHEMSSTALVRLATSPISDDIMARYRSLVRDVTDFHWIEVRSQLNMNVLGLLYAVDKAAPAADAHESLADAKKNWNRLEPALHLHLQSLRERYRALPKP